LVCAAARTVSYADTGTWRTPGFSTFVPAAVVVGLRGSKDSQLR
jgi:hypothetical protein